MQSSTPLEDPLFWTRNKGRLIEKVYGIWKVMFYVWKSPFGQDSDVGRSQGYYFWFVKFMKLICSFVIVVKSVRWTCIYAFYFIPGLTNCFFNLQYMVIFGRWLKLLNCITFEINWLEQLIYWFNCSSLPIECVIILIPFLWWI